jgi:hypothetical protein
MNKLYNISQTINRKSAVSQGFYDGRFRTKVVSDKKKTEYIKLRKQKIKV